MFAVNLRPVKPARKGIEMKTRKEVCEMADAALKKYSRRSKEAKTLIAAAWDMLIAGGDQSRVINAIVKLEQRYTEKGD